MGDGRRGTGFWGSGFFIAPGWVLTSAHVVGQGRGAVWRGERAIGISTADSGQFTGELACALPKPLDPERPPSPWGAPDLALVRVPELEHGSGVFNGSGAGAGPDCLWLSDRSALTPAKVGLYGYMRDPSGEFCVGDEGMAGGGTGGGPLMLRGNLPSGCSGGPVVDLVRASVIGVCRARAKDASNSALATPVTALRDFCDADPRAYAAWQEALRAHDRYHLSRYHGPGRSWPRIQVDLARYGHGFTADHRAELYGRFAELPPPTSAGQVLGMVNEARREVLRESYRLDAHAPRSWRDGVGLLYDPHDGRPAGAESGRDLEREAVLLYAAKVCVAFSAARRDGVPGPRRAADGNGAIDELQAWVKVAAVSLRNELIRQRVPEILDAATAPVIEPVIEPVTAPDTAPAVAPAVAPPATEPVTPPSEERSAAPAAPAPATVSAAYADVLVEIDPDFYGTHAWRVKLLRGDGQVTPLQHNENGVPRAELERDIRAALAAALDQGDIGEHLAAVDFMLPRALFDEPVEMWRAREASPGEPFSAHTLPLGHRRTVALRDWQRWTRQVIPEWRDRWRVIERGRLGAVPLCRDMPVAGHDSPYPESEDVAYGRLHTAGHNAVPVHCARVGHGRAAAALGVALAAGHPVALWRRCDERHADCTEFYAGVEGWLREVGADGGPDGLREGVRALRNRNVDPDALDPDAAWARQLVLLYDPPHGPQLPDGPLRAPPLRP